MVRFMTHITVALLLLVSMPAMAEDNAEAPAVDDIRWFIETQPLALVFGGASLGVQYQYKHLRVGGGAYFFNMPSAFVDQVPGNADEGWDVAIRPAGWLEGSYTLRTDGEGWLFGANLVLSNFVISNDEDDGETSYRSAVFMPKVGYTWMPFQDYFFVMPWLGVEFHAKVGGDTQLGERTFEPLFIQPFPSLSLGATF